MNRRKVKKQLKKFLKEETDERCKNRIRGSIRSLKLMKYWEKSKHPNGKSNMRILTGNFYRKGIWLV